MTKLFNWKLLLIITLLAGFLRFYQLSSNPPSLTWDEAAWGYNAYSLGIDGKDEFGRFLPYDYLESFGDFKPPMYAYLDVIPVKIFGLTEFAVRFPSALLGILTVLMTYFLVKRIFPNAKKYSFFSFKFSIAELTALFLAISPWHILLSRAAFEANVASFFIVFGVWAFLKGIQDKKWYLILSAVSFAFSIYTFNTARIVSPLLVIVLGIGFRKELFKYKRESILALILGFLIIIPIVSFLVSPQASSRFKEVNIFSDTEIIKTANQQIENDNNALWSKIIHNRRLAYSAEYLKHYFDNLNLSFLFIKGDGNPKFSTQAVGQMYLWDLPFFIAGILYLIRKREGNWWLIPIWILLGIIPAATARETPHALRIETTLPMFQLLSAYGFLNLILENKNRFLNIKKVKYFVVLILSFLLFSNFLYFYFNYTTHYAREYSGEWQYSYKESIAFVNKNINSYDNIYITTELGRPYIYYLFYEKKDPRAFRKEARISRDQFGFVDVSGYGKYNFVRNPASEESVKGNNLYVSDKFNISKEAKVLKTFYLLNKKAILVAYTI